ncbi:hypothetical protein D3C81_1970030 [compost metagenome]
MSVDRGFKVAIFFALSAAEGFNGGQFRFCQIGATLNYPCLTEVFAYFGIMRIKGNRALIIANPFIRTTQFAGGITPIVPGLTRIGLL